MGETREVAERFFERFGAGDIAGAMACFAPECISLTPAGAVDNAKHRAAAQALKNALPDSRMELIRVLGVPGGSRPFQASDKADRPEGRHRRANENLSSTHICLAFDPVRPTLIDALQAEAVRP
jgi:hypothetical protein